MFFWFFFVDFLYVSLFDMIKGYSNILFVYLECYIVIDI